jgi:hypothetical protein
MEDTMTEEQAKETDSAATEGNPEATTEELAASTTASTGEATQAAGDAVELTEEQKAEAAKNHEIAKSRREKTTAQIEAADERARGDALQAELDAKNVASMPQGRPNRDNFETDEGYEDALVDYRIGLNATESATKATEADNKKKVGDNRRDYGAGYEGAVERLDNFDAVAGDLDRMRLKPSFTNQVMASGKPHDIVYHLGKNPDEARRIASLSDLEQAREIGKLEAKFDVGPPTQKTTTNAASPGKDFSGGGTSTGGSGKETAAEYMARRNAEERAGNAAQQ